YFLAPHAYACEVDGYAVFLDLKHDKYTAVSPADLRAVHALVAGWQPGSCAESRAVAAQSLPPAMQDDTARDSDAEVIDMLLEEGLLTADRSTGRAAAALPLEEPRLSLYDYPRVWPELSALHLRHFVSAWAATTLSLRALPIEYLMKRVRAKISPRATPANLA